MKKTLAAIAAATMLSGGLVGAASTAQAVGSGNQVRTKVLVSADSPIAVGRKGSIDVSVTSRGDDKPQGDLKITVSRVGGGYVFRDDKNYKGRAVTFMTSKLPRVGTYNVTVKFTGDDGFKNDTGNDSFRVVRR